MLGLDQVGLDDDFFALGGDSLIAIRVSARLQAALGKDVPVRFLFDTPTVGGLAGCLDNQHSDAARPPLQVMPRPQAIPSSYAQQRLWFFDQLNGPSPVYNLAVGLQLSGNSIPLRSGRRWPMWWVATRACARCSPWRAMRLGNWWCRPKAPTCAGRWSTRPTGPRTGWSRLPVQSRATRSTCRPNCP